MIFTKLRKDCEQFRTQNTTNIWRENINARARLWRENAKLNIPIKRWRKKCIYLLLAEVSVRTVNYGPSFFPSIYGRSAKRAINRWKNTRIRNLQYGPKKEANKCLLYGFFLFGGPETSAGRTI